MTTVAKQAAEPVIDCKTKLFTISSWLIARLPEDASAKLPSRGQAMVKGTINGYDFWTPLEPDGKWGHWFRIPDALSKAIGVSAGDTVTLHLEPLKEWPNPDVPADLWQAVQTHPEAKAMWASITPMARWEWVRWTRSTNNAETRKRRVEVACSKMKAGKRRPCCWNRNLSTEPSVSKNGVLLDPATPAK
ncbi:MAG TPA: YdeI/OmpD-associated family protein [Candidatus Saccharimonadales bacterium]|nr:YdeI/OmpD-associated family protein [Candidatus Saccharimonadales bacterium]